MGASRVPFQWTKHEVPYRVALKWTRHDNVAPPPPLFLAPAPQEHIVQYCNTVYLTQVMKK